MKSTSKITMNWKLSPDYVRRLQPDETGGFVATIHEMPGCIGYGKSSDEALKSLEESAHSWVTAVLAGGQPVPAAVNFDDCSGKVALRISRRLHQLAAERAALEGTSLNQLISVALASYISSGDLADEVLKGLEKTLAKIESAKANAKYLIAMGDASTTTLIEMTISDTSALNLNLNDASMRQLSAPWNFQPSIPSSRLNMISLLSDQFPYENQIGTLI